MALTYAYKAIQDLTFTERQLGLGVTVTYKNTGTAGSEVVTVTDQRAITVAIQSGTSTATQIKAAVDAHPRASELVAVTVTGTGTNVQSSCVLAPLAGGAAIVAASKQFNGLYVEALTAGTGGNSIRVVFEDDTEDVTVSGNDITVKFPDGTTAARVAALINADVEANLLVKASGSSADTLREAMNSSLTALAGGAAAVAPSVIVQDLTIASDTTGTTLNGATISYSTGATAGSEVVTGASTDVNVQIENGVSTATQIAAAMNAAALFTGAKATGSVTVADYTKASAVKATGTVTVNSYAPLHLTKASGTITVTNYALLHKQKASRVVQDLTYTAVDFGTGGNSIQVQYVDAGAIGDNAVVEVVGNLIVVNMDDTAVTGSTADTIKAAVNADAEASLLVLVSGSSANIQAVQSALSLQNGQAAATVTANGTLLTESTDWTAETSDDVTATNLAAAVGAVALLDAAAVTNVVTVTAATAGTAGNALTLATSDASNLAKSGTTLAGGINAATLTVNGTVLTESTNWNAETNNDTTAANLEVAIEAVTNINSTVAANVITVEASTTGTGGNAYTLATSDPTNLAISGATLANGRAATTVTVAGTALVANVDWTAETSNNVTADNLASAIDSLSEVVAPNPAAAVIAITAAAAGTAGNAYGLVTSNSEAVTVSGATMSGGTDKLAVTVSGTGSTAQVTVNALATAGAVGEGARAYFMSQATTVLTSSYVPFTWSFPSRTVVLTNDETSGAKTVLFSFDGVSQHGVLNFGESLTLDSASYHGIFLKYGSAAPSYRLTVVG